MAQYVRKTAIKLSIKHLLAGRYIGGKDQFDPSGIQLGSQFVSRVNVMGILTQQEQNECVIEDGSGRITARFFEPIPEMPAGRPVLIIGRIREFNGARLLSGEIIQGVAQEWLQVRRKEVEGVVIEEAPMEEVIEEVSNQPNSVIEVIRRLDDGSGVSTAKVIEETTPEAERIIRSLLEQGEIFETAPGKVKILD